MKQRRTRTQRKNTSWIVGVGVAAILIVAGLVVASLTLNRPTPVVPSSSALSQCGTPVCGQANAPVTIEIYSDFQ